MSAAALPAISIADAWDGRDRHAARAEADRAVGETLEELRGTNPRVAELLGSGPLDYDLRWVEDQSGDPAVYVRIFLPDGTPDERLTGAYTGPIRDALFDLLMFAEDGRWPFWPYVGFDNRAELEEVIAAGDDW